MSGGSTSAPAGGALRPGVGAEAALLEFRGVTLGYGRREILEDVELEVARGDFLGIVGPNGSGKTTLLRAALGALPARAGRISRPAGIRVGYVPQRSRLDPIFPLRVAELVMMGRYPHVGMFRRPRRADHDAVRRAAAMLGIEDLLGAPFRDLSGGQQQRALIARALAVEPDLLVLDEPTNGMDLASERAIVDVIAGLHRDRGVTVLFVTHLLNLLADSAGRFALIHRGRVRVGERDDLLSAASLTALYGVPIDVHDVGGRRVIVARGASSARPAGGLGGAGGGR